MPSLWIGFVLVTPDVGNVQEAGEMSRLARS